MEQLPAGERDPEVIGTVDRAEAVEQTRALRPDVALMDLEMPGMDGVTATRARGRAAG